MRSPVVLLAVLLVIGACTRDGVPAAPGPSPSFDERLDAAFAELDRSKSPILVAVSRAGGPIVARGCGALRTEPISAAGSTLVDLNSITKTVTGVMVMRLVDQGRLRLDETLAGIFPHVPADKGAITVHQLLTHSAGLPEAVGDDAEQLTRDEFLRRVFATALLSEPGARYNYSNVGYSILAAIIEERSGVPYETYLQRDVLGPAGLPAIGYAAAYDEVRSLRTGDGRPIRDASWGGHDPSWNLIGNGGLVATPQAFIRFRQAVAAGQIVSRRGVEQIQTKHVSEDAGLSHYGYGLVVQDVPNRGRLYWHDGGNNVFSAEWADYADRGDVLFTAAADSSESDAFLAMSILRKHLYGSEVR